MFIEKTMHPARKTLRITLLALLACSLAFFALVVNLRMTYHHKMIRDADTRDMIFKADILQHRVQAYFSSNEDDMILAENLLRAGFFSPLYTQAGLTMLKEKSDSGYAPARVRLAQIKHEYGIEPPP